MMQKDIAKERSHFEQMILRIYSFGRTSTEKENTHYFDYQPLIDRIYNYKNVVTDKSPESEHVLKRRCAVGFPGCEGALKIPGEEPGAYYEHWRFEADLAVKMKVYLAMDYLITLCKRNNMFLRRCRAAARIETSVQSSGSIG